MKKTNDESVRLLRSAKELADDVMELHVLSFRMGCANSQEDDYTECQQILARACALREEIEALQYVPRGTSK